MQIVIPMSGFGERFRRRGYCVPKPLIDIDGKTMIEHVVAMFPGERDIVFICNEDHLAETAFDMRGIIETACPTARVVSIPAHKLGPLHAVREAAPLLDPDTPTIVNYCDFSQLWDYEDFKTHVRETDCDGSLPSYRGFHPHSLGSTFYAYLKMDEMGERLVNIQEKKPWTDDPMSEFASSGTYYFKSAQVMLDYFDRCEAAGLSVGGEYYISMVYRPMAQDGLKVTAYEVSHFMQWGTPDDLLTYQSWDRLFRRYRTYGLHGHVGLVEGSLIVPMAGLGSRFAKEGYTRPKPLIDVDGRPMVLRVLDDLPQSPTTVIVTRKDLPQGDAFNAMLAEKRPDVRLVELDGPTDGQAITCASGLDALTETEKIQPVTIGACDNGVVYDAAALSEAMKAHDCVVWGVRGHAAAAMKPESYSWIGLDNDGAFTRVGVKEPIGDVKTSPVVIGTFSFANAGIFEAALARQIEMDDRHNGEFYADALPNHLMALGYSVGFFEIDHYVCFGTPDELKTYEYYRELFSRWSQHPFEG